MFANDVSDGDQEISYEERVTIWPAASANEAIALAENEAEEYATTLDVVYLGLAQVYTMAGTVEHGAEVFSLTRCSHLRPRGYLDAFFDTGHERQQAWSDDVT